jgi:two-component system, NtrC family, nitrogen regulation sensor histidine kinase NtrY
MIFNKFYRRIAIRVVLLTGALFLFSYCVVNAWLLRAIYAAAFAVLLLTELVRFINQFTRTLSNGLAALEQGDFTVRISEAEDVGELAVLYRHLNRISEAFRKMNIEKEVQHQHLETLVSHLNIGILSFEHSGKVHLVNKAFLAFSGRMQLLTIGQIEPEIREAIQQLDPTRSAVLKLKRDGRIKSFGFYLTEFKIGEQYFKLVSVQDITNELSLTEIEAWQKLIRVLTHEIMNSITPIISLSNTLHHVTTKGSPQNQQQWNVVHEGIEAIRNRSAALQLFTQHYRELTQLPHPEFSSLPLDALLSEILLLYQAEADNRNITLVRNFQAGITVIADRTLLQQAIINVFKNAIDAVDGISGGQVEVASSRQGEHVVVEIRDNGNGIGTDVLDKIFIPFFTTKKNGSGIGLALSRQIISLHKGQLIAENNPGGGATFKIVL